jgi:hypothetical protein
VLSQGGHLAGTGYGGAVRGVRGRGRGGVVADRTMVGLRVGDLMGMELEMRSEVSVGAELHI